MLHKPLLSLLTPAVQLAIGFIEIAMQRPSLVLSHAITPLVAALLLRIAATIGTLVAGTWTRAPLLRLLLHVHIRALQVPDSGCGRSSEESGCDNKREQNFFHLCILTASIAPVGGVIPIIKPALRAVLRVRRVNRIIRPLRRHDGAPGSRFAAADVILGDWTAGNMHCARFFVTLCFGLSGLE
jgi:hypothetical protein